MFLLNLGSEPQNLVRKITGRSEDSNKIKTEFARSRMFP